MIRTTTSTGSTTSMALGPAAVLRIVPAIHRVGALPPVPPAGAVVPIATRAAQIKVEIATSDRACLVLAVDGARWIATPIKPNETSGVASYPEGTGATDWVIRGEG